MTKMYLGVPMSSVSCERIFSDAGNIISDKQAALLPGTAEMLVFLHANWKL